MRRNNSSLGRRHRAVTTDWINLRESVLENDLRKESIIKSLPDNGGHRRQASLCLTGHDDTKVELEQGAQRIATGCGRRRKGVWRRITPLLRRWLPMFQLFLLSQNLIPKTNCDLTQYLMRQEPQAMFDVMPELEDLQLNTQLSQQKSFDYLTQQSQQQPQQQEQPMSLFNQMSGDNFAPNSQEPSQSPDQQNLGIEELLESQPSASSAASTAPRSPQSSQDSGKSSSTSTPSSSSGNSSPSSSATSAGGSNLGDQLSALTALLQHINPANNNQQQSSNGISDSLINGVTNSILDPIRSQTVAMSNIVRKTINGATSQATLAPSDALHSAPTRPNVGQGINGNIEFDSDSNSINGNIEWPSLSNFLNGSSKPSLSSIKPFVLAALKTVPIKLGSVGWKLLQLIAWKKIYKTHHPKSGEIIIEQETSHSSKPMEISAGKGKSMHQLDHSVMKTSKMGNAWPMGGWKNSMMGAGGYGQGGWPMDGMPMSASMVYQRHLMPPAHPAAAAAAAAAATAAALQSQWAASQLMGGGAEPESVPAEASPAPVSPSNQRNNQTAAGQSAITQRKKSWPSAAGGNWFASPAHAYAAAAAAAAATAVSQQQQNPINRLGNLHAAHAGAHHPFEAAASNDGSFLAGLVYQNLFDNAAAMAVQNAVKLPHHSSSPGAVDYLEQSDSLPGSSLTLGSFADVDGWSSGGAEAQHSLASERSDFSFNNPAGHLMRPRPQQPDSLLALQDFATGPQSIGSMADFDDTPAGRMLDLALNSSSQLHSGIGQTLVG